MKNIYPLTLVFMVLISQLPAFSQGNYIKTNDEQVVSIEASRKTSAPFSVLFKETTTYRATDAQQLFQKYLGLRPGTDELRSGNVNTSGNIVVTRYQQYFKGIKVELGNYTLVEKEGRSSYMTGDFLYIDPATSIIPVLSENEARTKAWLYRDGVEPGDTEKAKGEIVFMENAINAEPDGKPRLAWKFFIDSRTRALTHENTYVDATTGQILFTDNLIKAGCYKTDKKDPLPNPSAPLQQTTGPSVVSPLAATIYSGTVNTMVTRQVAGLYRLEAILATELYPNHTRNINHALVSGFTTVAQFNAAIAASLEITDADNSWTLAEYNNANKDNTAFDVHWGSQRVYDYWKTRHARNSWDGADGIINCFVHGDINWDNAFWQGGGGINSMFYGDGSNVAGGFTSLTCLDVTAHEIGHGVCQATSALVYSNQSGAMNEGFSDIWGAAIEHFADPHETDAVPKSYFDIGEEITVGGGALRSMSNPKLYGQPDTYLGTNWYSGTADNGGVHTNSGVLNYWFYLLVMGKNGTNDLGNSYSVPAIGWVDAERIAFLTETSLSSSANYSACRTASINAATTLFGACSLQLEAVTRAWYAVGVGADYAPCVPNVMFVASAQSTTETGTTGSTCLKTKTITVPVRITSAATQAATVNFTLSGTAASGANMDYTVSPSSIVFPASSTANQNLTITINNDAYVEGSETIILTINTVTTSGNAVAGNAFQQHTITITDDDYNPSTALLETSQTLFSENFTSPGTWLQATAGGSVNTWRLGRNAGTDVYFGASNPCAFIGQTSSVFTYNNTATSIARLQSPSIVTTNCTNLQLTFDYVCNGEFASSTYWDFGTLWYSIDGGSNWLQLNSTFYQGVTTKTTVTVPIPANANNITNLQIGFRWDNDNTAGSNPPFGIDNIIVRGDRRVPAIVQSSINAGSSSDQQYLGPNATVNFYDNISGNIMGTIQNLSAHDYGCTTFEVDRAGTSALFVSGDVSGNDKQRLSSKTFRVTPTTNNTSGSYRITLYYTAAEKAGYESASTRLWTPDNGANNGLKITKSPGAISALTSTSSGVRAAIESVGTYGADYTITAQFTNGFSGFAAGVPPVAVLPISILDFNAVKNGSHVLLNWRVAQQVNVDKYIIQHSTDGNNFIDAGTKQATQQTDARYDFTHLQPVNGINFYRIRIINEDGSFRNSSIAKVDMGAGAKSILVLAPNPVTTDHFTIQYKHNGSILQLSIVDATGRILRNFRPTGNSGSFIVNATDIRPGIYMVKMLTGDNEVITQKLVRQ